MPETAATARETAQKLRDLAKASGPTYGNAYLAVANRWEQEAIRLETAERAKAMPAPDSSEYPRAA